jgi:hypothetical protein
MRWLMIVLLVSLVALLMAAAGLARHIWVQHERIRSKPAAGAGEAPDSASAPTSAPAEKTGVDKKI